MDVIVSGASGLVGAALLPALRAAGHRPVRLVRGAAAGDDAITWDPAAGRLDAASLEGAGAVVHLAGAGIGDHRWTDAYKAVVMSSRVEGTTLLAETLAGLQRPPGVLLSASAMGWYGDRGEEVLTEASAGGDGFAAEVCRAWEASTAAAADAGIRVAHLRSGVVLSPDGGALGRLLLLFRLGLGGPFGSGRQWWSWIGIDDEVGAMIHLLGADVSGPVNLTAPEPVRNKGFATTLGHVLHRPAVLPVPRFGPSLLLGSELTGHLLYSSLRVVPEVLLGSGYAFAHPDLEGSLRALLDRPVAEGQAAS